MPSLFVYLEKLCRNEGVYRLPSGTRNGTNYSKSKLAPEELDRTRRNRCTVRNSDNDGGSNAHMHITRRIGRHTSPGAFACAKAARLHGDGEAGAAADSLHEQGEALPAEGLCTPNEGLACAESAGASCLAEGVPFGEENTNESQRGDGCEHEPGGQFEGLCEGVAQVGRVGGEYEREGG